MAAALCSSHLLAAFYRLLSKGSNELPSLQALQAGLKSEGHGDVSLKQVQLLLDTVDASGQRLSCPATVIECVRRLRCSSTKGGAECDSMLSADVLITGATLDCTWERNKMPRGQAEWAVPIHHDKLDTRRRIVFCHGGGYCRYSADDPVYRSFCSRVASRTGLPVLSIDYRLAPEHGAPAALEDALAAVEWAWDNGPNGSEPATHVILGGDSAGGGLALGTFAASFLGADIEADDVRNGFRAKGDASLHRPPSALWALSAWTDLTCSLPSYTSRAWDEVSGTGDPLYTSPPRIEIEKNIVRAFASSNTSPAVHIAGVISGVTPIACFACRGPQMYMSASSIGPTAASLRCSWTQTFSKCCRPRYCRYIATQPS